MLGTSQHITVTKRSHERHTPCCQTTSHSPKQYQKIHDFDEAGNTQIPHEVGLTLLWAEWSRHKEGPPLSSHHWKKQLFDWSVRDVHTNAREDLSKLRFGSD